jgi:hypothetical protein
MHCILSRKNSRKQPKNMPGFAMGVADGPGGLSAWGGLAVAIACLVNQSEVC